MLNKDREESDFTIQSSSRQDARVQRVIEKNPILQYNQAHVL